MDRINVKYNEYSQKMLEQLEKGVFLTTKVNGKVNTMTIAWGGINVVWNKKVFVAYVRYTRETYKMLEETDEFTINVPLDKDMHKELSFCGTKSGRDYDKIKEAHINLLDSRTISTPILADCDLHYECKVIYKQAMEPNSISNTIKNRFYSSNDFHVVYYGEIVDSYLLKGEK
jgi:flavin reductase (DIM6/NTAB) family NADH-FMN oxidoreductase RutF